MAACPSHSDGTNQVCCYKKKKLFTPKCGRHNKVWIRVAGLGSDPETGISDTEFGEWPHVCLLFKTNRERTGFETFIGGASLIAPGVLVTAAHNVV